MLERIQIENLGPIQKADLTLGDLTVLLGANASGKTTVMRAIKLAADLRKMRVDQIEYAGEVLGSGLWVQVLNGGKKAGRIVLGCWSTKGTHSPRFPDLETHLGTSRERMRAQVLKGEPAEFRLEILQDEVRPPPDYLRDVEDSKLNRAVTDTVVQFTIGAMVEALVSADPTEGERRFKSFIDTFGTARYFRPHTDVMLAESKAEDVTETGAGFQRALARLQNQRAEDFQAIEKALGEAFPHIKRIRFDAQGGIVFETTRAPGLTPAKLEAEGVLSTLFLLWAGYTTPEHGTLLLDEPEVGLHPHLMVKRVGFLRDLAEGKVTGHKVRVVVATQSVDFVGCLSLNEIRIVEHDKEKGTQVMPVPMTESLDVLVNQFKSNAGDLWFTGNLGAIPGTGE
jgi:predicted ATPase